MAAYGCNRDGGAAAQGGPTAPPPVVQVATVTQATVPISEDFVGTSGAITSVDVTARVAGTLEEAPFKEGTLVHQGELIFKLQQTKYLADLQAAQAQLLKGQADLKQAEDTVPVLQAQANVAQKLSTVERQEIAVARLTPLAREKAVPQKDLDNALTSLEAAKADLIGAEAQLHNAKVTQPVNIDMAKAEIEQAQSQVTIAKLNLSYTMIYAPVTGLIGFLKYDVGNVVGQTGTGTDVLDTITTVDPIKVDFAVDENTYLELAGRKQVAREHPLVKQPVNLVLANGSTYEHPGYLYTVNPTLDAKTGTINVEARFPNPDALIRPGQFARVRLVVQERPDAVLVPQEAVVQAQGTDNAYVVERDGTVAQRSVTLGPRYENEYVVDSGLKAGDRVIVQGTQKVRPGIKVQIVSGSPPKPPTAAK
jgi:membrane fusion protein, multidrug efflux system